MDDTQQNVQAPDLENTADSAGGVVSIDGQKYAVGLMWQPVQNLDDPYPEIHETIESEADADLYCLRQSPVAQYGIGRSTLEHKDGMPSLAAAVASALSQYESFCAVFKTKQGWWFLAVRNNLILAEEDILFKTEEEAKRAYTSMMAVPNWDVHILPKEWGIDDSIQLKLEDLASKGRKIRLQAINAAHKTYFLLFIAIVIVMGLGGLIFVLVNLWQSVFPPQQIQAIERPDAFRPVTPTPEKPKPWEKMIETKALISACWNDIYQVKSVSFPGWRLGLITCNAQGITTNWTKESQSGLLSWMRFGLEEYQFTDLVMDVSAGGNSATGVIQFTGLPVVASVPTLTREQLYEDLTEIQQSTKVSFQFGEQTMLDPPNRPDGTRPQNQKSYTYFSIHATSEFTPWEWIKFFEKFSGFELIKIEYNPSNDTLTKWKYEGRIYAK